jgi:hypothetical protein
VDTTATDSLESFQFILCVDLCDQLTGVETSGVTATKVQQACRTHRSTRTGLGTV